MDYSTKINSIIDNLNLPEDLEDNKEILKARFVEEVSYYEKKRDHTKKYYNVFRFIVTTGSILLPALLSIGQMDPTKLPRHFDRVTYWSTWSISLMVTISNGFLQLFSLDKNYFNYSLVVEQLKTEGWQYFGLSGKYEEYDTHTKEAYKDFSKAIENIKRKQVEQEFQGKGNNTKKKKPTFDFSGEMQAFMKDNAGSEVLKKTLNQANNIKKTFEDGAEVVKKVAEPEVVSAAEAEVVSVAEPEVVSAAEPEAEAEVVKPSVDPNIKAEIKDNNTDNSTEEEIFKNNP